MEAVTAMTELLLAGPLDPTQARYAEMLYQSSRGLLGVLNDVLDFSRLDGGRMELQHINFDLHDLVQGVGPCCRREPTIRASPAARYRGELPELRCRRCRAAPPNLMSLIENALKFTSVGSVRLHANASETDGRLVLRFDVTDTGVGLSKAVQERLFLPFGEIDKQRARWAHRSWAGDRQETRVADGRRGRLRKRGRPRARSIGSRCRQAACR